MNWIYKGDNRFYLNAPSSMEEYFHHLKERRGKYPIVDTSDPIKDLRKNGFCIIPNVFTRDCIDQLSQEFEDCVQSQFLKSDDSHFSVISEPLLNSKACFEVATSDIICDLAGQYFRCTPSLCTQNLRLSKLNDQPAVKHQLFHCDQNSLDFIKFFIYLNDVDINGGPLTYMRGSHKKKPTNHLEKYRWTEKELVDVYGKESVCFLTASSGDLLIANTTGFHRGTKPTSRERRMLTLNYVVHEERGLNKKFKTRKEWVEGLPDFKRPLFDFMELV